MELNLTQINLVAQICELATRMNVPFSAADPYDRNVPDGAVLMAYSAGLKVYMTKDQLGAAKRVLRIAYSANRDVSDPNSPLITFSDQNEDLADDSIPESFTYDDVVNALKLGIYAAEARVEVRNFRETSGLKGYMLLESAGADSCDRMPFKHLELASRLFEIVCQENHHFRRQDD